MRRRRKFELLLKDFWGHLAGPAPGKRDALSLAVWNLADFDEELTQDATKVWQLTDFVQALRASDAAGRQVAEEELMKQLGWVARQCRDRLEEAGFRRVSRFPAPHEVAPEFRTTVQVLEVLRDFALGCFEFKRPRDSLGGRRRALAFDVLSRIGTLIDLPEALVLARQALRRVQSIEADHADLFLDEYLEAGHLPPDDSSIESLLALAEKTHSTK